jgi:hypothetical protein
MRCTKHAGSRRVGEVSRSVGGGAWGWEAQDIAAVVGSAGVYSISEHFLHEKRRGVHNISPMCGNDRNFYTTAGKPHTAMALA